MTYRLHCKRTALHDPDLHRESKQQQRNRTAPRVALTLSRHQLGRQNIDVLHWIVILGFSPFTSYAGVKKLGRRNKRSTSTKAQQAHHVRVDLVVEVRQHALRRRHVQRVLADFHNEINAHMVRLLSFCAC